MEHNHLDARSRILMAAKKLFALHGFAGTSVRQICEEANTNAALISYYFGGKENVYQALFDIYSPVSILKIDDGMNPIEGIQYIVQGMTKYRFDEPEMVAIIQQEASMNNSRLVSMKRSLSEIWLKLRYFLNEGKKQGLLHFNSVDKAIIFIIAIISFPSTNPNFNYLFLDDDINEENKIDDTLDFILKGLGYSNSNGVREVSCL